MTNSEIPDPRPLYTHALTWAQSLMSAVEPAQLDAPTPCDYDVRTLLGHLVATVDRLRILGEGGAASSMPVVVTGVADDGWAEAYGAAVERMWTIWRDDAALDRTVAAPWGSAPGRAAVWGYLNETLVHGWDLAVATGQDDEADAEVATVVLAAAPQIIPAEPRGGEMPFAPAVTPREGAGPTEQLANWSGHCRG